MAAAKLISSSPHPPWSHGPWWSHDITAILANLCRRTHFTHCCVIGLMLGPTPLPLVLIAVKLLSLLLVTSCLCEVAALWLAVRLVEERWGEWGGGLGGTLSRTPPRAWVVGRLGALPTVGQEGAGLRGDDDAGDPAQAAPGQVTLWGVGCILLDGKCTFQTNLFHLLRAKGVKLQFPYIWPFKGQKTTSSACVYQYNYESQNALLTSWSDNQSRTLFWLNWLGVVFLIVNVFFYPRGKRLLFNSKSLTF